MALLILNADGGYVKHSSHWASTLNIFKYLQKHNKKMAFEACLPENMTVQNLEGYLLDGPFMGYGADDKYRIKPITDWQRYVRARCRAEDVAVVLAEAQELKARLAQEE
jgi:hypothetical protein